ncbi:glycoprotein endo-alpha-1,2-mannosidase [Takifugu rubripes]|uniref:Glycoprotein endo-alpha-1,2-mannosidase n=1 Tax=Takifugu rubripes TaxID=31033 RepID=A0A674MZZ3_TAKRU|nr:glycoprotein endo-alpha-1,2-mannosidase-like [Takifugu rubripes]XP_011617019.1 glycoprotein endo-alpha-1,2-mannosidase-like [Takifugu rubripes]XP_011617026.1 glycoprotein endo-alpha-1,2-mannosidase-like [Takifugu rubripes]XP_011617031.1 glycoprotein endo-alpha-1,2-mannosidase-like [Takifugu rubripes]|eukprot:XP_011617012.1 PREDICTED: glycoprotein endo-alpha-1,2-mannosidase-like [Takifugu rubripes]
MARFRRKYCLVLIAVVLLVLTLTVILKALSLEDIEAMDLFPARENSVEQKAKMTKIPDQIKIIAPTTSNKNAEVEALLKTFPPPNYYVHAFYYAWYGNPKFNGKYIHWDHPQLPHWDNKVAQMYPQGRHSPPDDLGSNFYPSLGPYSSRDPAVVETHMQQLRTAAIGVIAISWYPPDMRDDNGESVDDIMPLILEVAHKYLIKVTVHIEPYKERNEVNMFTNVKYIIERYGAHPAFFRYRTSTGKLLPLFYVYDSYLLNSDQWAKLLKHTESNSIRDTPYDAIFIALLVEEKHKRGILAAGFDGLYTYFATNGFSFGSTQQNWKSLKAFCEDNDLIFIPSVGPGYIDTSVRPWNFQNTRNRINGKYYENSLSAALQAEPDFLSVTSFNEWHEGTQIEMAIPKKAQTVYLDYLPNKPTIYLEITRKWAAIFGGERRKRQER